MASLRSQVERRATLHGKGRGLACGVAAGDEGFVPLRGNENESRSRLRRVERDWTG